MKLPFMSITFSPIELIVFFIIKQKINFEKNKLKYSYSAIIENLKYILLCIFGVTAQNKTTEPQKGCLIINGSENEVSEIHRVWHFADKLRCLNISYFTIGRSKLCELNFKQLLDHQFLYIHRCSDSNYLKKVVEIYQKSNRTVIYDIDDLVFEPTLTNEIRAIKEWRGIYQRYYQYLTQKICNLMLMADYVFTSTNFLKKIISQKHKKKCFVLCNHLDDKNFSMGLKIAKYKHKQIKGRQIILGYFSGTSTHQDDFVACEDAVLEILKTNRNVTLKLVGEITPSTKFLVVKNQVVKLPLQPYHQLIEQYRDVDINLIPLERNNIFCQGKSELKYFFAGICGIPSIATPTDTYKSVILDGVNGLLVDNRREWTTEIKRLIHNPELRKRIGRAAQSDVQKKYSMKIQAAILKKRIYTMGITT